MESAIKHFGQSDTEKPLVIDLFCGLGGWSQAFLDTGFRAIGFDIEAHDYGKGGYPGELVLRDVRSITGAELVRTYGVPAVIVCSPPCQEFSYMAMPWTKAKEKMRKIEADPAEQKRLCDLFNQCFRIQREVSAAAGHYVPMVVENVRGAQRWVGKARWNFGSFYLWGDVPALMPIPGKSQHGQKLPVGNTTSPLWSERPISRLCDALKGEGNKTTGMNWSNPESRGKNVQGLPGRNRGVSFTDAAGFAAGVRVSSDNGHRTAIGNGARFTSRDCGAEGTKQPRIGGLRDNGKGDAWFQNGAAPSGSKSSARRQASAEIAKIPTALASWIAKTFKPKH